MLFRDRLLERIKNKIDSDLKYFFLKESEEIDTTLEKYLPSSFFHYFLSSGEGVYFDTTLDWFTSLLKELRLAKRFIFLEFFSIAPGIMWEEIFVILKEKRKQGVEVRIIYDNLVSAKKLPPHFASSLNELGILCQPYYQKCHLMGTLHNRHLHRKVVIIDGVIAFTGGMNIGDEYLNLIRPYGDFKDVGVSFKGHAVWGFTAMFLSFWNAITSSREDYWKYYFKTNSEERGKYCVYGDNPLSTSFISEEVFSSLIGAAKNTCFIYTPYFLPPKKIRDALVKAARRGVEIKIILPGVPDKKIIYFFSRLYAFFLRGKNIQFYFYQEGFIHGKVILIDDKIASVGNVNLDYYSLHYNFEYNVLIHDQRLINDIKQDMINILNCPNLSKK